MTTPFGEINGTVTPRLKRLVNLLNRTGLRAKVSTHIVDYLATHAAGVAALVPLVMKYGNNIKALARSPDDLKLAAAAMRETIPVLKALGHKIVPAGQQILAVTPVFVLAFLLRLLCNSKFGEVGAAWHMQQAPDEMQALADDLRAAVIRSGVPAPAHQKSVRHEVAPTCGLGEPAEIKTFHDDITTTGYDLLDELSRRGEVSVNAPEKG